MNIKDYIIRGIRYVIRGIPVVQTSVNIVRLSPSELLKGKTAIITGGTSGIGKAIAVAFIEAGARVCITGRDKEKIRIALNDIRKKTNTTNIDGIVLDNSNVPLIKDKISYIIDDLFGGQLDILVNNAGVNGGNLNNCSEEEYQNVMDTNLKGTIFLTRVICKFMIDNHVSGNILNICSSSSLRPANTAYVISKWGLRGYTLGLAKQLIKHNIVVNGLAPGPTATPMLLKDTSDITLENNPSGRFAMSEEIANLAVVLTSSMGRMVVGDILYATGGAAITTFDDLN